jgi:UDP-glucose 6-dehydrogenase
MNDEYKQIAEKVLSVLPTAPFTLICTSSEAEIIKYSHNVHGYMQVVFSNILFEMASKFGCDWEQIKKSIEADPMMSHRYLNPIHKSGRGAGGSCFIKDFAAFRLSYEGVCDEKGLAFLKAIEAKNIELLIASNKNLDILNNTYDKSTLDHYAKGQ